ncbi:MAG: urea ABC transporter permease subunit UrtB [Burkholderiales bacterium]|nr:urea ABC transporter permease subunit UrtB [Burkholderiales bacterium]
MRAFLLAFLVVAVPARALDEGAVHRLVFGDADERSQAIAALVAEGDPRAATLLRALAEGEVATAGRRILLVKGETVADALTGEALASPPEAREEVVANNRLRREIEAALAALQLVSPARDARLAAARALAGGADETLRPLVRRALAEETDPEVRALLELAAASLELRGGDRQARLSAIRTLGASASPQARTLLAALLETRSDGGFAEPDPEVRAAAQAALRAVEARLAWGEFAGLAFAGLSLGSILLLAALGLAITYGVMGVINMAHGEMIMVGAYATYVVQSLFRAHAPEAFGAYLAFAVPAAFAAAALLGMALERGVIRRLYGRPLETLLATWGLSLILMQAVRTLFGAQNVQVEAPAWLAGGVELFAGVVLPWNRIAIVAFAAAVLGGTWLLLARTRLGLFVRGVTQNRDMAACLGVPTARVDTLAFGLGSGIAGLAGCALTQIGNVGPDLGQAYIVDSFMVVVFGGVGQLAGTVVAALALGFVNKLLEAWSGAVIAKIAVLVFVIFFIQRRPQGLFALKGRAAQG